MGSSTATGCLRHDEEMDRRTEEGGIRIVDPQEAIHENTRVTTMWFFHLCSAILFERWLGRMTIEQGQPRGQGHTGEPGKTGGRR